MMTSQYKMLKVGAAMDDLDIGPLISKKQYDIVSGYIEQGKDLELAATGIFKWVKATRDYFYIFKDIEPRRDAFMLS